MNFSLFEAYLKDKQRYCCFKISGSFSLLLIQVVIHETKILESCFEPKNQETVLLPLWFEAVNL